MKKTRFYISVILIILLVSLSVDTVNAGHQHTDSCYKVTYHVHNNSCYEPIYHRHTDSCYTINYHHHTGSCYQVTYHTHTSSCTPIYCTGKLQNCEVDWNASSDGSWYKGQCNVCGNWSTRSCPCNGYACQIVVGYSCGKTTNTVESSTLICGKDEDTEESRTLKCGKTEQTQEGRRLICGKTEQTVESRVLICGLEESIDTPTTNSTTTSPTTTSPPTTEPSTTEPSTTQSVTPSIPTPQIEPKQEAGTEKKEDTTNPPQTDKLAYTFKEVSKRLYVIKQVNIRDIPSSSGKKLGSLEPGTEVNVTGRCNENNWYRIKYNNQDAFVSDAYLDTVYIDEKDNTSTYQEETGEGTPESLNDEALDTSTNSLYVVPDVVIKDYESNNQANGIMPSFNLKKEDEFKMTVTLGMLLFYSGIVSTVIFIILFILSFKVYDKKKRKLRALIEEE